MNRHEIGTKDILRTALPAGEYLSGWWVDPLPTPGWGELLVGQFSPARFLVSDKTREVT
jgi:hypothetical protein